MMLLCFTAISLALSISTCFASQLGVLVNGENSTRRLCEGTNVTFICTVNYSVHFWYVPKFQINGVPVAGPSQEFTSGINQRFILRRFNSGTSVTSLSVIAFPELHNTDVSCTRGNLALPPQNFTITLLGTPTQPIGINVVGNSDYKSFKVVIIPPVRAPTCVGEYSVTVFEDTNAVEPTEIQSSGNVVLDVFGLNACRSNYSFRVETLTYSRKLVHAVLIRGLVRYSGSITIGSLTRISAVNNSLYWSVPEHIHPDCFSNFSLYFPMTQTLIFSTSNVVPVRNVINSGIRPCSTQQVIVTPIVPARKFDPITSGSINESVFIGGGEYFRSPPEVDETRTTNNSITIMFDVYSGRCEDVRIIASIYSSGKMVSIRVLDPYLKLVRFSPLPSGLYRCNVSVVVDSPTRRLLLEQVIDCTTKLDCNCSLLITSFKLSESLKIFFSVFAAATAVVIGPAIIFAIAVLNYAREKSTRFEGKLERQAGENGEIRSMDQGNEEEEKNEVHDHSVDEENWMKDEYHSDSEENEENEMNGGYQIGDEYRIADEENEMEDADDYDNNIQSGNEGNKRDENDILYNGDEGQEEEETDGMYHGDDGHEIEETDIDGMHHGDEMENKTDINISDIDLEWETLKERIIQGLGEEREARDEHEGAGVEADMQDLKEDGQKVDEGRDIQNAQERDIQVVEERKTQDEKGINGTIVKGRKSNKKKNNL